MENKYDNIPLEKFEMAQEGEFIHDEKFKTKSRNFYQDALIRFRKNKSSVVAAYIIAILVLYAIIVPIFSPYSIKDTDNVYTNMAPYIPSVAAKKTGNLDGGSTLASQSENQLIALHAIGQETGYDPVIKLTDRTETTSIYRGKERTVYSYSVKINSYYNVGIRSMVLSYDEFDAIQKFQNETGIQVLFPMVDKSKVYPKVKDLSAIPDNPNIWYVCSDAKSVPKLDKEGNLTNAYLTDQTKSGGEYYSQRIEGDTGEYIYSLGKSGSVLCRVCYYNYYQYKTGHEPSFLFGTDVYGRDLFNAIAVGARFSLAFALMVSIVNIAIGVVYGSLQGYYGGAVDMVLDRISDILSDIPMLVVVTLFNLHLAPKLKYGAAAAFFLAFIATGWIGVAYITRKQFYRFKSQEYVTAARTLGASDRRLMFKHILPNSLGTLITSCALIIPGVVSSETQLTYLGIINLSNTIGTCVGDLMAEGQKAMTASPHAMFYPAVFFALLMLSFNLFGNGLRDAVNPSTRGTED